MTLVIISHQPACLMFSECVTCSISSSCHFILFYLEKRLVVGNRKVCAQKENIWTLFVLKSVEKVDFWDQVMLVLLFVYQSSEWL